MDFPGSEIRRPQEEQIGKSKGMERSPLVKTAVHEVLRSDLHRH